jgi:integrase
MNALRAALAEYVAIRRSLGSKFQEPAGALGHFLDFLEREHADAITTDLALRWAQKPKDVQRATWARRLSAVRGFAAWLSCFDRRTEVPPRGLLNVRHRRNKPHIYTDEQITRLMAASARLRSRTGLRALTYTTLIGLLAATGLRPGEAVSLDIADVDLVDGVLAVRDTKFGKSRFVPLETSTRDALARYARRRDVRCPHRETNAFLISERGRRIRGSSVRRMFARLCTGIGLRPPIGPGRRIGRGPRLQDVRHTFATRRLVEWYRAGADVERELPKLATYLGHAGVTSTYWYIEAVPELLQLATARAARATGGRR